MFLLLRRETDHQGEWEGIYRPGPCRILPEVRERDEMRYTHKMKDELLEKLDDAIRILLSLGDEHYEGPAWETIVEESSK